MLCTSVSILLVFPAQLMNSIAGKLMATREWRGKDFDPQCRRIRSIHDLSGPDYTLG